MGCANQIGCLGPKPREREVYLDLIDKIYHEATSLTIDKKQEKYTWIKNHLLKKGLLRKLIDNLVSHRANLQECLLQNLQMAEASNDSHGRVTSLIIVDKIFDEMFNTQPNLHDNPNEPPTLKSSKAFQKPKQSKELPSKYNENYQNVFIMTSIFMKLILYLLQNDKDLYRETANSLKRILNSKIETLIWKGQIQNIFQFLIKSIKKDQETDSNIELAGMILKKVKQNLFKSIRQQTIQFLIKQWIDDQREIKESKIIAVLKQYFKNVQGQYQVLYESIMIILDEAQFELKQSQKISQLLDYFQIEAQGSKNFKKGLLTLLLKYLQLEFESGQPIMTQMTNYQNEHCKLNGFKLLTKWIIEKHVDIDAIIEYNPTTIIRPYLLNIEKKSENHFKNELKVELFKIISLLKENSVIITINKICEQFAQKEVSNHKRQFLLKLVIQLCDYKDELIAKLSPQQFCKMTFLINIENYYNKQIKMELLQFAVVSLQRVNLKSIMQIIQTQNVFLMKIAEFLDSVWQEIVWTIKEKHQQYHEEQSNQSKEKKQLNNLIFICKFTKKFQSFLMWLKQSELKVVLISFMSRVNSYMIDNDPFQNQEQAIVFFIIQNFISKTMHLLNTNIQIPEAILSLSKMMQANEIKQEVREQIVENAKIMLKKELSKAELGQFDGFEPATKKDQITFLINNNKNKIQTVQHSCNISQEQKIQMDEIFKYYFCAPIKGKKKEEAGQWSSTVFKRVPSINLSVDQITNEKMSCSNEGQESFMEIMQKMKKE